MKNLQSLLTEKGINVIANDQMFMVRGGSKTKCKVSVKSMGSNKSFGSKNTRKDKGNSAAPATSNYCFARCY
jgi:hypothetical protein